MDGSNLENIFLRQGLDFVDIVEWERWNNLYIWKVDILRMNTILFGKRIYRVSIVIRIATK